MYRLIFKLFCQAVYPEGVTTNRFWIFEKSRITPYSLSDLYQNWIVNVQYYALTALQILRKPTKACANYLQFFYLKCARQRKTYKENKTEL